jgi:cytoskeletal protein CcmA (bactofilin family)
MFGKRKAPAIRSLIGEGTVIHGEVRFVDGLRVDGEVHGDVVAATGASLLVVSEKARVIGKVMASHVIINGRVEGPVESSEMLELQPAARVEGDIRYAVLEMHPGALIDGELRPIKNADKPALTLAAAKQA